MWSACAANLKINAGLVGATVQGLRILRKLPHEMWSGAEPCTVAAPVAVREEYEIMLRTARQLVKENAPEQDWGMSTHNCLVAQRLLFIVVAALSQDPWLFVAAGLLQYVVAPYSLAVSLGSSGMYWVSMCLGHCCTAALLRFVPRPDWSLELNYTFLSLFLLVDFAVSCYYSFVSAHAGPPKRFSLAKTLHHIAYGGFNGKTYVVLYCLACRGARIDLAWLLLDAVLGTSAWVNNLVQGTVLAWEAMFYHLHRLAHLPVVYEHAHKPHHHLQDCMAFDAQIFSGAGFPEELPLLFFDVFLLRGLGVPPPFLTYRMLAYQLATKDIHTRKDESYKHEQYHQDHHTCHRVNFGFGHAMLDMFFGTFKQVAGQPVQEVDLGDTVFGMVTKGDQVILTMRVNKDNYEDGSLQKLPAWQLAAARRVRAALQPST